MTKHLLETATLVLAALLLGVITNAMAARDRKLTLPGYYPNATTVPARAAETPAPVTTTMSPAPGNPPITITTTETVAPVPVPTATTATMPVAKAVPTTATTGTQATPATPPPAKEDVLTKFPPHDSKPYVEIHGDDVAWLYARGVLFLDARRTSVYEQGHIAGARSFSVWEADVDEKVNKLFEERNDPAQQLQPIVIYCSGGDCEDSHMLAQKLWGLQFNNVYVYKDGYPDWVKRSGATRTGGAP